MPERKGLPQMLVVTIVMGTLALVLLYIGYQRGGGEHIIGLKWSWILTLQILPLIVFSFIIAGMINTLIPKEAISNWIGAESGLRGILIGTIMGGLTPSGPFVSMPIAASLLRSGASIGTMVAFLTGWSLIALHRLPMEIGFLGWQFTLIRLACVFFFPPIAGLLANALFSRTTIT